MANAGELPPDDRAGALAADEDLRRLGFTDDDLAVLNENADPAAASGAGPDGSVLTANGQPGPGPDGDSSAANGQPGQDGHGHDADPAATEEDPHGNKLATEDERFRWILDNLGSPVATRRIDDMPADVKARFQDTVAKIQADRAAPGGQGHVPQAQQGAGQGDPRDKRKLLRAHGPRFEDVFALAAAGDGAGASALLNKMPEERRKQYGGWANRHQDTLDAASVTAGGAPAPAPVPLADYRKLGEDDKEKERRAVWARFGFTDNDSDGSSGTGDTGVSGQSAGAPQGSSGPQHGAGADTGADGIPRNPDGSIDTAKWKEQADVATAAATNKARSELGLDTGDPQGGNPNNGAGNQKNRTVLPRPVLADGRHPETREEKFEWVFSHLKDDPRAQASLDKMSAKVKAEFDSFSIRYQLDHFVRAPGRPAPTPPGGSPPGSPPINRPNNQPAPGGSPPNPPGPPGGPPNGPNNNHTPPAPGGPGVSGDVIQAKAQAVLDHLSALGLLGPYGASLNTQPIANTPPPDPDDPNNRLPAVTKEMIAQGERENARYDRIYQPVKVAAERYAIVAAEQMGQQLGHRGGVDRLEQHGGRFSRMWRRLPFTYARRAERRNDETDSARIGFQEALNGFLSSDEYKEFYGDSASFARGTGYERAMHSQMIISKAVATDGVETLIDRRLVENAQVVNQGMRGKVGQAVYWAWRRTSGAKRNADGTWNNGRFDVDGNRVATWRRVVRSGVVVVPAVVFGGTVGVATAAVWGPALLAASAGGLVAGVGGRVIGHKAAKAINRRQAAFGMGHLGGPGSIPRDIPVGSTDPNGDYDGEAGQYYGRSVTNMDREDFRYRRRQELYNVPKDQNFVVNGSGTEVTSADLALENGFTGRVQQRVEHRTDVNQRRNVVFKRIGAWAAGAGVAAEHVIGEMAFQGHPGHPLADGRGDQLPAASQHHAGVGGGTPPGGEIGTPDPNQYPWLVAHQIHSGSEWQSIQNTINYLNAHHVHGGGFGLVHSGGYVDLAKDGHLVGSAMQDLFNQTMISQGGLGLAA